METGPGVVAGAFDADRDGVISMAEWDRARAAAREQITAGMVARPAPATNLLAKPRDGRAFLLAAADGRAWRAACAGAPRRESPASWGALPG